ncbi:hypothetical protein ACEWPL_018445 [Roseovarius sp. S1116L3]|uniref:hypothetical protein n=1 Tax=Roseovarius roseus TaxID=3342636 RepID=UPI00372B9413
MTSVKAACSQIGKVSFERSTAKLFLAVLIFAVFTLLAAVVSVMLQAKSGTLWPWLITLLMAGLLGLSVRNLLKLPQVVYELTEDGISLFNVSDREVSWQHIETVSVLTVKGASMVVLNFSPEFRLKRFNLISQKNIALNSKIVRAEFSQLLRAVREAHPNFHIRAGSAS